MPTGLPGAASASRSYTPRPKAVVLHPRGRKTSCPAPQGMGVMQSSVHRAYVYIRYMCASGIFTHQAHVRIRHMCTSDIHAHQTYVHIRTMCTLGMCASGLCACQAYVCIRPMCTSGMCVSGICVHQTYVCTGEIRALI